MDRTRLVYAVVGLLAVAAVGLSAATLTDTTDDSGGTTGVGADPDPIDVDVSESPEYPFGSFRILFLLLFAVLAVTSLYGLIKYPRQSLVEFGRTVFGVGLVLAVFWVLFQLVNGGNRPSGGGPVNNSSAGGGLGGGGRSSAGTGELEAVNPVTPDTALITLVLLVVLGVGAVGLVAGRRRRDAEPPGEDAGEDRLSAIGRSAGRLAERLESDVDADNEVYRAWKEMTGHLDLENPGSRTPGEFRAAAVEAGLAREDVDALTELFEEVRYGGSPASPERERRAVESLRRIERRYTEGEA